MIDEWHARTLRFLAYDFRRRALGSDEEDFAILLGEIADFFKRLVHCRNGVLEIDNVDFIARAEDELVHLWIPVAALVAEMDACAKHIFH
jgi:hypothetical protein